MSWKKLITGVGVVCAMVIILMGSVLIGGCRAPEPTTPIPPEPTTPTPPEPIKLVHSCHMPKQAYFIWASDWWMDEVEKRTNGRVQFERHWAGEVSGSKELLPHLRSGAVDISYPTQAYFPTELPLGTLVDQTRATVDLEVALRSTNQVYWHEGEISRWLQEENRKQNIKMLYHIPMNYQCLSRMPIYHLSDMDGIKWRSVGPYEPKVLSFFGAIPVSTVSGEAYEALSRGSMDGICYPRTLIPMVKLYEVAKYVGIDAGACTWPLAINLDTWNRLPSSVQDVMIDMRDDITDYQLEQYAKEVKVAQKTLEDAGCTFYELAPGEQQKLLRAWIKIGILDTFLSRMEDQGLLDEGKALADRWLELMTGNGIEYWEAEEL